MMEQRANGTLTPRATALLSPSSTTTTNCATKQPGQQRHQVTLHERRLAGVVRDAESRFR
jgi:hypothetical protein